MAEIPNLAGTATADLVETIKGAGSFKASYINWSRTVNMLREHAPGWMPELVTSEHGSVLHRAPVGAYLLIRFRHTDGTTTPEVPQAIMDNSNKAIPLDRIDARDITDTHRRGVCLAAAFTFGLAYELWAKMPLESGFADNEKAEPERITEAQEITLRDTLLASGRDEAGCCAYFGVEKLSDLPADKYEAVMKIAGVRKAA